MPAQNGDILVHSTIASLGSLKESLNLTKWERSWRDNGKCPYRMVKSQVHSQFPQSLYSPGYDLDLVGRSARKALKDSI